MAKKDNSTKSDSTPPEEIPVTPAKAPGSFPMTLQEYCVQLSQTDRRVELIGAFEKEERRAGHAKATAEEFATRFAAFAARPA